MINYAGHNNNVHTWRSVRDEIAALRDDLRKDESIMTQYERAVVGREIKNRVDANYQIIANGQLGEWRKAIKNYMDASAGINAEYSKEINRWDSSKLLAEMQTARTLVEIASQSKSNDITSSTETGARLSELYAEAKKSGDLYKQRAVFELLRNIDTDRLPKDARLTAAVLKRQAASDLSSLRVTPGLVKAQEAQQVALQAIVTTRDEMILTGKVTGEYDPEGMFGQTGTFGKALRMVQMNRKTGEVMIYPEDSVEVTGVSMAKMPEGSPVMGEGGGNVNES
jgi:hypothetical protein